MGDREAPRDAQTGLTKRELIAAMAMQGLLANPVSVEGVTGAARAMAMRSVDEEVTAAEIVARGAVAYANALLRELYVKPER